MQGFRHARCLATVIRSLFRMRAPSGSQGRLSILIFHRVLPRRDALQPDIPDADQFDSICRWMRAWFDVLPLPEAVRRLQDRSLPAGAACITFDDGYADNYDVASPILHRHGLPATVFVATGYLDGGRMFNDSIIESVRRAAAPTLDLRDTHWGNIGLFDLSSIDSRRSSFATLLRVVKPWPVKDRIAFCADLQRRAGVAELPRDLMMSGLQVQNLHRAGITIGAHTVTHPILAELSEDAALNEMTLGRAELQSLTNSPIGLFAYPNGRPDLDYRADTVDLVRRAGFDAAVSTAWGVATPETDRFQLPRYTPWTRTRLRFAANLWRNLDYPHKMAS